jgi:hypothetical protein
LKQAGKKLYDHNTYFNFFVLIPVTVSVPGYFLSTYPTHSRTGLKI